MKYLPRSVAALTVLLAAALGLVAAQSLRGQPPEKTPPAQAAPEKTAPDGESSEETASEEATSAATGGALPEDYSCIVCHKKDGDLWSEQTPVVNEKDLVGDVHWVKGIRCHDCHGGSPELGSFKNHRDDPEFHAVGSRELLPAFCGRCHSDLAYMRQFNPSARTDQEAEYWTSGHGRRLKASMDEGTVDAGVATCVDCHGHHHILTAHDTQSPVYPTRVGETCARCHSDEKLMAGRVYNGHPLPHDQYAKWQQSVHGIAMLEKGDTSAPTCNDCHGNHGALPPGVDSVANACGVCHGKVAKLFATAQMKHKFEDVGLPGCATCHGSHNTVAPTDDMLGMSGDGVCQKCHNPQNPQYGATLAGGDAARTMREKLEQLKVEIGEAEGRIREAERLGMMVQGPRFDLRQALDSLTDARTQIHSFQLDPLQETLKQGLQVTTKVKESADAALHEHTYRRIWLAASLIPLLIVVGVLMLFIRTLPSTQHGT